MIVMIVFRRGIVGLMHFSAEPSISYKIKINKFSVRTHDIYSNRVIKSLF